jgi:hypothetical protein
MILPTIDDLIGLSRTPVMDTWTGDSGDGHLDGGLAGCVQRGGCAPEHHGASERQPDGSGDAQAGGAVLRPRMDLFDSSLEG